MLFCWLAASVAIKSILLPVDLEPFWILPHVFESYQRLKMEKQYSYIFFPCLWGKVQIIELSYCPDLLPGALSKLTGKQQVSGAREAARQKPSVQSNTKTSLCFGGYLCLSVVAQYSYSFSPERLDFASVPVSFVILFLTFAFLFGWRSRRIYKQRSRMRWRQRTAQGNHIEATYEKAALTKIRFKEETIVMLEELFYSAMFWLVGDSGHDLADS